MTADDADDFFEWYVGNPQVILDGKTILGEYKKDPKVFMKKYS